MTTTTATDIGKIETNSLEIKNVSRTIVIFFLKSNAATVGTTKTYPNSGMTLRKNTHQMNQAITFWAQQSYTS